MAPANVESSLSSDQTSKSCYGPAHGGSKNNGIHKRAPVIRIVHIFAPKRIKTDAANFRARVQELTGNTAANIKETSSASNEVLAHNTKLGGKKRATNMQALEQPLVHSNAASNTHEDEPSTGRRSEESAFDGDKSNYPMLYTYPNTVNGHSSPIKYNESQGSPIDFNESQGSPINFNGSSISWQSCESSDDYSIDNFFGGDPDAIFYTDQQQSCSAHCGCWRLPFYWEIPGGFDSF